MKILNLILAAIFLVFAALQLNDPDWEYWTAVYLITALICGFTAFGKGNRWIVLAMMAACVYELYTLMPAFREWIADGMPSIVQSMKASSPFVELVREFLGVVITLGALIFQYIQIRALSIKQATRGPEMRSE